MQVLCDFYNMHLVREGNAFATDTERQHVIGFFKQYCPRVVGVRKQGLPDPKLALRKFALGGYEQQNGKDWFESEDYGGFRQQYWLNIVSIVDGILVEKIKPELLRWLADQRKGYVWDPKLIPSASVEVEFNYQELKNPDFEVAIGYSGGWVMDDDSCEPERSGIGMELKDPDFEVAIGDGGWWVMDYYRCEPEKFGIGIGNVLFSVIQNLVKAINDPELIAQCRAEETPKCPACRTVFTRKKGAGRPREWCSRKCQDRDYKANERKKHRAWKLPLKKANYADGQLGEHR